MPQQQDSLANQVRTVLRNAGGRDVRVNAIADELDMIFAKEKKPIFTALRDMRRRGEVAKSAPGVYRYLGRPNAGPQIQQVMWRVLRARRTVTVDDMRELAGASKAYAQEWLGLMVRHGVVRRHAANGKYQLVKDVVEMPRNDAKAAKLRRLRQRQKEALAALDAVDAATARARQAIKDMEVDDGT